MVSFTFCFSYMGLLWHDFPDKDLINLQSCKIVVSYFCNGDNISYMCESVGGNNIVYTFQ